jgi:hypothetical protein
MPTVHARTLRRAAEIIADDKKLAEILGITPQVLALWKSSNRPFPQKVFLKAVDIVVAHTNRHPNPTQLVRRLILVALFDHSSSNSGHPSLSMYFL